VPRTSKLEPTRVASRQKRGLAAWCVNVPEELSETGTRRQLFFTTQKAADAECDRLKAKRDNFGTSLANLSQDQLRQATKAFELLDPYRVELLEAVQSFVEDHKRRIVSVPFLELFNQFIDAKEKDGRNAEYLRELRITRDRFSSLHERISSDITPQELDAILAPLTPGARNPVMRYWRAVFFFGIKKGFLKENPVGRLDFAERKRKEIEIIPVDKVKGMLHHALKEDLSLLPYLVFGFFAGIRPDGELQKLEWDDVKLSSREIVIRPEVSKTNRRRFPKLSANALQWLEAYRDRGGAFQGKVCPYSGEELRQHRTTNRTAAGITRWIQQGMRHTFCSNHLAHFKKLDELVLQSGHDSVDTMWRNYHKGVSEKEAKAFWGIRPPKNAKPKNVIRMAA
jgi:integrase